MLLTQKPLHMLHTQRVTEHEIVCVLLQTTTLIVTLTCLISSLVVTSGWGEQCIHICTTVRGCIKGADITCILLIQQCR